MPDRRPITPALPAGDQIDSPRVVLRDGTVASIRAVTATDRESIRQFFHDLSPDSRRKRFFTSAEPSDSIVERMTDSSDPHRALTLIVHRLRSESLLPVAIASYMAIGPRVAEVAFAVDDSFQGKGLATLLLERLAIRAAQNGFEKFQATTLVDNMAMLEVFRDSGFAIRSKTTAGVVDLQLSLTPSAEGVRSAEHRDRSATAASLVPMLTPRGVAVIGVSRDPFSIGRRVFEALRAGGFAGPMYPVNPNVDTIDGAQVYRSARDLPAGTDLAVVVVPAAAVLHVVDDCAAAGVKSLVVISAGFAEAGESGRALQRDLVERVRNHGMRMVGPNCMGVLNATANVRLNASFSPIMPPSGTVSLLSQSGALGIAILELATRTASRTVDVRQRRQQGGRLGQRPAAVLGCATRTRPSSCCISSRSEIRDASPGSPGASAAASRLSRSKPDARREGSRAAGSHTAALAASDVAVDALFQQAGVIRADTIDEMFDIAACLDCAAASRGPSCRRSSPTRADRASSLLTRASTLVWMSSNSARATRARLAEFLPPEAAIGNPVDMVASAGADEYRRTVEVVMTSDDAEALIVIFTPVDRRKTAETIAAIRDGIAAGRLAGATAKAGAGVRVGRTRSARAARTRIAVGTSACLCVSGKCGSCARENCDLCQLAIAATRALLELRRHPCRRRARALPRGDRHPGCGLADGRRNQARTARLRAAARRDGRGSLRRRRGGDCRAESGFQWSRSSPHAAAAQERRGRRAGGAFVGQRRSSGVRRTDGSRRCARRDQPLRGAKVS